MGGHHRLCPRYSIRFACQFQFTKRDSHPIVALIFSALMPGCSLTFRAISFHTKSTGNFFVHSHPILHLCALHGPAWHVTPHNGCFLTEWFPCYVVGRTEDCHHGHVKSGSDVHWARVVADNKLTIFHQGGKNCELTPVHGQSTGKSLFSVHSAPDVLRWDLAKSGF